MSVVRLDTGFNIEIEFPISTFGQRFGGWLIDLLVIIGINIAFYLFFRVVFGSEWYENGVLVVIQTLPVLFYHLISEILLEGQSLGKKSMHIRVITEAGGSPNLSQYLLRWMFRIIDFGLMGIPAILSFTLSPRSQRLGDIVAGTLLIDTRREASWQDTVFEEIESNYVPRYPDVMKMTDKDINTLKKIIQDTIRKGDDHLASSVAYRISDKFGIKTDETALSFLQTLLKDYNYYTNER